jgi:undecaprenyl pyrophosphate phosphatase UppP
MRGEKPIMDIKKYKKVALLSLIINFASIFNAVLGLWSFIMLLFAFFINNNIQHASRIQKDKKRLGVAQTFMVGVFIFLSTIQTFIGIVMLNYVVQTYLANYQVAFILLAVIGAVIYYYFCINLFKEALRVAKQKEVNA